MGMCNVCGFRRADRGYVRCSVCREEVRERAEKLKAERKAAGLCPRDGRPLARGRSMCKQCLHMFRRLSKAKYEERTEKKLCGLCGRRKCAVRVLRDGTRVQLKSCAACRGKEQHEYSKAAPDSWRKRKYARRRRTRGPDRGVALRARQLYLRRRAAGLCVKCATPTAINPRTKHPFSRCPEHS